MICTWCSQLCWAGYIKEEIFGDGSDLTGLLEEIMILFCRGKLGQCGAREISVWQGLAKICAI